MFNNGAQFLIGFKFLEINMVKMIKQDPEYTPSSWLGFLNFASMLCLQGFRPLRPKSQRRKRLQWLPSRLHYRDRTCWVSALRGPPAPVQSSLPAVCLGTALWAARPRQAVADPFLHLWHMARWVHTGGKQRSFYLATSIYPSIKCYCCNQCLQFFFIH